MSSLSDDQKKVCSQCGKDNACNPNGSCWCKTYPPIFQPGADKSCLCEPCLNKSVIKEIDHFMADLTPEKAEQVKALKQVESPSEGIDYYFNEQGLFVFTGWYLLRRGYCCDNDCLNCPYN
ncbi:MAG: hypothetical protein IH948_05125 [Bacteroidetes bacterium]|nr:hypothetical protein [Bacteroidota bacterium]